MQRVLTALVLVMVTVGAVAPFAAAAPTDDPDINYAAGDAPDVYVHEDSVTIAQHDRAAMTDPLNYYDDNGDVADLGDHAHINDSETVPVGVRYTQINDTFLNTFPRVDGEDGNSVSAVDDKADWSATTSGGTTNIIDNDGGTATGVDSVKFETTSMTSGDSATYTYSNFSVSDDPTKRVAFAALNIQNVDAKTNVSLSFVSSDGDTKNLTYNQTRDPAENESIIANSSGDNLIVQERLADLNTSGSGDGTFEDIQKVNVTVTDGNANVTLVGLDVERKSEADLGEIERDTDDDGEVETTQVTDYWEGGDMRLTSLDTLPSDLDSAVIRDLKVYNLHYPVSMVDDDATNVSLSNASDHPGFDTELDAYMRLDVPTAIDLSHGTLDLRADQTSPNNWYQTVEYATGTGDTDLHNVSYTDKTDDFSSEGSTVTLASGVSAGDNLDVHIVKVLTADASSGIEDTGDDEGTANGGGGFFGSSDGGLVSTILSPFGGAITAILAFLGIKKRGG